MKPYSYGTSPRPRSSDKVSAAPPSWRKLPSSWWRLRSDFGWALGAMVLTSLWLVPTMQLWRANLWMPFTLGGDAPYYLMVIKGILRHGWWLENPDLGAPSGQELYDFPFLAHDGFHVVLIKLLGLLSSDPVFVANLFFLLSFPLVALTSFLVLRQLGISGAAALVCSVLYALAPYHFLRDHQHLNLAAYYSVPVGAYLVLSLLSGKPLFARRTSSAGARVLAWASRRSLITLVLCLFVASASSTYYAVFAILLLIAATTLAYVTRREARTLFEGGAVLGLILSFLGLALLPHLIYWFVNGPNYAVANRLPYESEVYGLVLTQMVLPIPGYKIGILSDFAERYYQATPLKTEFYYQSLGFVATLGFGWLLLVALASSLSPRWGIGSPPQRQLQRQLGTATIIAVLIGTTGGISSLFAWLISPQFRAWDRISIFISFFALAAVALLLDAFQERARLRAGRPVLANALLLGVLLIGLLDLSANTAFVPHYETAQNEYKSDAVFVEEIDHELPSRAAVFQLPYVSFPENVQPGLEIGPYEPLRPYLQPSDLRWSYGAVKGRPSADWRADLVDEPTETMLNTVVNKGFDGIYIDRFGYPDRAAELEGKLSDLLEVEPLVSPDGRRSFFSLLSYKEKRALDGEKSGQWAAVSYPQEEDAD